VREHTANVVAPDDLDWMDEGPEGAAAAVVARVLQAVESRFHTPLASSSAEDRTALARCLSALILLLQEHPRSDEQEELEPIRLPLLPSFTTALSRLVDGAENEITPSVRAETYRLLGSIIRHDDLQWSPHSREYIARLLHNGLSDPNRSVRLTAGSVPLHVKCSLAFTYFS
jgi:serine/threonine-protein kinase ATR